MREHNLPSTKDVGDKSFRECVLEPLIKELASFEQSINYSDPQYHLIAVKLLSLSFMSHGADIARNQNFEFMRYLNDAQYFISLICSAISKAYFVWVVFLSCVCLMSAELYSLFSPVCVVLEALPVMLMHYPSCNV